MAVVPLAAVLAPPKSIRTGGQQRAAQEGRATRRHRPASLRPGPWPSPSPGPPDPPEPELAAPGVSAPFSSVACSAPSCSSPLPSLPPPSPPLPLSFPLAPLSLFPPPPAFPCCCRRPLRLRCACLPCLPPVSPCCLRLVPARFLLPARVLRFPRFPASSLRLRPLRFRCACACAPPVSPCSHPPPSLPLLRPVSLARRTPVRGSQDKSPTQNAT